MEQADLDMAQIDDAIFPATPKWAYQGVATLKIPSTVSANKLQPVGSRNTRPIHYFAIAVPLLVFATIAASFGLQNVMWAMTALSYAALASLGLICLRIAIVAHRAGFIRSGLGRIERVEEPTAFWTLLLLAALVSPLLIGLFVILTHW
ncbi:MAG TPA: hypothetical protein VKP66_09385 [Steroidobacteraceae bacterium]|nr:hypothetical protein [Steroidobacteraceae bacterium]